VLEYLIKRGFASTAEIFARETMQNMPEDSDFLTQRQDIRRKLQNGQVDAAIDSLNALNPNILEMDHRVYFQLGKQKLVEYLRNGLIDQGLDYAAGELADAGKESAELLPEMERTMGLFAFANPKASPLGGLLSDGERRRTAEMANAALLRQAGDEEHSDLEKLMALLRHVQCQLAKTDEFPMI